MTLPPAFAPVADAPDGAAVVTDFDGTLAPIIADPAQAAALPGAVDALATLTERVGVVAVISGRPVDFLADALPIPGLELVGLYGFERLVGGTALEHDAVDEYRSVVADATEAAVARFPGLLIEPKGPMLTIHWRTAPGLEPSHDAIEDLAGEHGLDVSFGRKSAELRPPLAINKGSALEALLVTHECASAVFIGDDRGDLAAFDALDRLVGGGSLEHAVRVGVRSPEAPAGIVERADVVVDGPPGVADLLHALASALA